ncbi:AraC family transcriptional regulator [Halomonas smyrnensis]|uniref:AraC family transcriptional regulator n=1 Tax=Halomonas smyrnensis TaxID=720605 RepID=UPI0002EF6BEE|nr:AraC family transcriptional regulator [Halomonas smyrnensis]
MTIGATTTAPPFDLNYAARQLYGRFLAMAEASGKRDDSLMALIQGLKLPRDAADHGMTISLTQYFRLLQESAPLLSSEHFHLRLGHSYDIFDLGILGYALISASNLQRSWDISLGRWGAGLLPHPLRTQREVNERHAKLLLVVPAMSASARDAFCDEWLAGTWRWICQRLPELTSDTHMEVHFPYARPGDTRLYHEIFPGRVVFAASQPGLYVPVEYYRRRFSSANPSVSRLCNEYALEARDKRQAQASLVEDVRYYLVQNARIPFPTLEQTAVHFRLPPHTLRRRLREQGRTFRHINYEVRMRLARRYLLGSDLSVQEIGFLVGYEQATSFHRAFVKWFGQTPLALRQKHWADG